MHNVFASILELIHCFAANSKFRGANCSHKQQDVGVEEEKSVLALVCPGYSQSVSLSDCWFQLNSNPTWLLSFGDAAAKQELHYTRDIGIPWHQYWYRHRIWSPCIINSWEIDALTWRQGWKMQNALSPSAQVDIIGPLPQSAKRGNSPRTRATWEFACVGAELQQVEWRNSSAIQSIGSSGFSPKTW